MSERRHLTRARSLLSGRVIFNNRNSVIDCTIRDISDTGARISFAHPVELPAEFELDVPKRGASICARLMWSHGKDHGIAFAGGDGLSANPLARDKPRGVAPPGGERSDQTVSSPNAPEIREILNEARRRIADLVGVPIDGVKLKVEIDAGA